MGEKINFAEGNMYFKHEMKGFEKVGPLVKMLCCTTLEEQKELQEMRLSKKGSLRFKIKVHDSAVEKALCKNRISRKI